MRAAPAYEHCTLDNFDPSQDREALDACQRFAIGGVRSLLLLGPAGCGKTHLLYGLARAMDRPAQREDYDDNGYRKCRVIPAVSPVLWHVLDYAGAVRGAAGGREDDPEPACRSASILLLDDWGAERTTDFVLESLERLIDWRYRYHLPTAVSSNIGTPQEWVARYGDRMLSRLSECGRIVRMKGRDRRPEMGGASC